MGFEAVPFLGTDVKISGSEHKAGGNNERNSDEKGQAQKFGD